MTFRITCANHLDATVSKRLLFLVALLAATLVPSAAVAASRPTPTSGISSDVTFSPTPYSHATTTLHVTNARLVM